VAGLTSITAAGTSTATLNAAIRMVNAIVRGTTTHQSSGQHTHRAGVAGQQRRRAPIAIGEAWLPLLASAPWALVPDRGPSPFAAGRHAVAASAWATLSQASQKTESRHRAAFLGTGATRSTTVP
jgi:hypothetical protein